MFKCHECDKEISNRASCCPFCGHLIASEAWLSDQCHYSWRELFKDEELGRALYITQNIIGSKEFHNAAYESPKWTGCSLRKFLNIEFFGRLPQNVKERTLSVRNANPDNPEYGTSGGEPTSDRIFLLSIEEASFYFLNNDDRITIDEEKPSSWWWLRSPGGLDYTAAGIGIDGSIAVGGYNVLDTEGGIRPALWLSLYAEVTSGESFESAQYISQKVASDNEATGTLATSPRFSIPASSYSYDEAIPF